MNPWMSLFAMCAAMPAVESRPEWTPVLQDFIVARIAEFPEISPERRRVLEQLAKYAQVCRDRGEPIRLTFICTHNSRRSHLSQIWAQAAAAWYGVPGVATYSGGTEATAFNPRAVRAVERAGFVVARADDSANPRYLVRTSARAEPWECFSKVFHHDTNPQTDFAAIMTCTQADSTCPLVPGAALRLAIPFEDPKAFDGTPEEGSRYDERCRQIAREMFYAFSLVK